MATMTARELMRETLLSIVASVEKNETVHFECVDCRDVWTEWAKADEHEKKTGHRVRRVKE